MLARLTLEQQNLVVQNLKLVPYVVFRILHVPYKDSEDIISLGNFALCKAAGTFDTTKSHYFPSYAIPCIKNEILMHFRKVKTHVRTISLEQVIMQNEYALTLKDCLVDSTSSHFVETLILQDTICRMINVVLNSFSTRDKIISLYAFAGYSQKSIADTLGTVQPYIFRLEKRCFANLMESMNTQPQYVQLYTATIENNQLKITFSPAEISNFNEISFQKSVLNNFNFSKQLNKVVFSNGQITLSLPLEVESFAFLADFFQEIEGFSFNSKSKPN